MFLVKLFFEGCSVNIERHMIVAAYFNKEIQGGKIEIGPVLLSGQQNQRLVLKLDFVLEKKIGAFLFIFRAHFDSRTGGDFRLEKAMPFQHGAARRRKSRRPF